MRGSKPLLFACVLMGAACGKRDSGPRAVPAAEQEPKTLEELTKRIDALMVQRDGLRSEVQHLNDLQAEIDKVRKEFKGRIRFDLVVRKETEEARKARLAAIGGDPEARVLESAEAARDLTDRQLEASHAALEEVHRKLRDAENRAWGEYQWEHRERREWRRWCATCAARYRNARTKEELAQQIARFNWEFGERVRKDWSYYEGTDFFAAVLETQTQRMKELGLEDTSLISRASRRMTLEERMKEIESEAKANEEDRRALREQLDELGAGR